MKVDVNEARKHFNHLLNSVEKGQKIIITRDGKEIAILMSKSTPDKRLPNLTKFRNSIRLNGETISETIARMRRNYEY